jgi:hypothetical protein
VPLSPAAVRETAACLRAQHVRLVAPAAQDACGRSLAQLAEAFGDAYRPLRVGEEVLIEP